MSAGRRRAPEDPGSVPVEVPLQRRDRCAVQGSRAVAARADPGLERADGAGADRPVGAGADLALQRLDSRPAEDSVPGGTNPVLGRPDRVRAKLSIDHEPGIIFQTQPEEK